MKHIKRIGAIVACAALSITSMNTGILAEEANDNIYQFNTLDEYIEFSVPRHLYAQQIDVSDTVEYSEPISLYNFSDNTVVGSEIFLIDNGNLIGKMDIYESDDNYTSYFDTTITDEIVNAYTNGDQIAIGGFENSLLLYSNSNGFSMVDGVESDNTPLNVPTELSSISVRGDVSSSYIIPYSIANINLNVSHVHNSTTYNSAGQCWAACVAMKINYHFGSSLKADSIYSDLTSAGINFNTNGTQTALSYYGYTNYTRTGNAMRPGDVATQLTNNKPVIMHISNASGSLQHAVVIKGIVLDTSSSTYSIDDPNYSSTRTIVHTTNMGVINSTIQQYSSLNYGYTKWYNSFY